jgi:hypothetical protein
MRSFSTLLLLLLLLLLGTQSNQLSMAKIGYFNPKVPFCTIKKKIDKIAAGDK